jgi:hypothetical protein
MAARLVEGRNWQSDAERQRDNKNPHNLSSFSITK